jgi:hypothetical protein
MVCGTSVRRNDDDIKTNARNKKIKITAGYMAKKIRQQKPPEHSKP